MDPDEVLRLFRQALAEHRWRDAAEAASLIDGWMTAGGDPPKTWARTRANLTRCVECGNLVPQGKLTGSAHKETCPWHARIIGARLAVGGS